MFRDFEKISGPPPGPNCFFSPPPGAFYWDGGWWIPKQIRTRNPTTEEFIKELFNKTRPQKSRKW